MTTELSVYGQAVIDGREPVGCELHVTQEIVDVSTNLPRPDPSWSTVDGEGHFHAAHQRGRDVEYPTLTTNSRPCDGACGDPTHREAYYVCRICSVEVQPGTIPGPHYDSVPGLTSWECAVAANVPYRKAVSIRIVRDDVEWFGVAEAGGGFAILADGSPRSRLIGVSPLGRRQRKEGP